MVNLKHFIKNYSHEEKIGILLFFGSLITLIYILTNGGLNKSVWQDELFTLNIINFPYFWVMGLTAADVHPPLYYFILKAVFDMFTFLRIPFNTIVLGKLVSLVPFVILLIFNLTTLKKKFGWLFTGIFGLFIVTMPQIYFGFEIRMYSWAFLFLTLSYFYAYEITENSKLKNWALLIFFSLMGAYTHYYAMISSVFIFLLLLIWILLNNRNYIKKWIYSVIAMILGYLPWIIVVGFVLINNIANPLDKIDWMKLVPFQRLFISLFIGSSLEYVIYNEIIIFAVLFITIGLSIYFYKSKDKFSKLLLQGWVVLIFTILFGVIISLVYRPIFTMRYIIPTLGCLYLSFAFLLSKLYSKKRKIFAFLMIIFIISTTISVSQIIEVNNQEKNTHGSLSPFLSDVNSDEMIVYNDDYYFYPFYNVYRTYEVKNMDDIVNPYTKMITIMLSDSNVTKIVYTHDKIWVSLENNRLKFIDEKLNENGFKVIEHGDTYSQVFNSTMFYIVFE